VLRGSKKRANGAGYREEADVQGATEQELESVVAPVCASCGVVLVDVERRASTVLVTVERSGGLDLDALAQVSRDLSSALDARDDVAPKGRYELEVTTPGLERRLRRPAHFHAVVGERLSLRTVAGTPGPRRFDGTLMSSDEEGVDIQVSGADSTRRLSYSDIDRAHTVFDWGASLRAAKTREAKEKAST
jgi:ribosome maturation factor RimP